MTVVSAYLKRECFVADKSIELAGTTALALEK
jgi:hypothetical protein